MVLLLIIQSFDWMESFQLYSSNTEPQFITFEVEQRNTSLSGGSQPISYFMIKGKIEVFKLLHWWESFINFCILIDILASIFSVLIILTLCGNSLVLFACITNKNLQQPCNYFLASLACADLGVGKDMLGCVKSILNPPTNLNLFIYFLFKEFKES